MKVQQVVSEMVMNQRLTLAGIENAYQQLGTGKRVIRPGDSVVDFEATAKLKTDAFHARAQLQSLQNRVSWFQSTSEQMDHLEEILNDMLRLARQSADPSNKQADREIFDVNFQESKKEISKLIDGESGREGALATMGSLPLLLGNFVPVELSDGPEATPLSAWSVNLFTNYAPPGEVNPDTLAAAATFSSQTHLQLPGSASSMENYYIGTQFEVTSGAGTGQVGVITAYDANTKIATFSFLPQGESFEQLHGPGTDQSMVELNLEGRFADEVWGANNMQARLPEDERGLFIPLTQAEIDARVEAGIPATNQTIQTSEERLARRQLNIFDPEYGGVATLEQATNMSQQVELAIEQISLFQTRVNSKLANLQKQISDQSSMQKWKEEGIGILEDANLGTVLTSVEELTVAHQKILELSLRLSEAYGKLNQLIENGGTRG